VNIRTVAPLAIAAWLATGAIGDIRALTQTITQAETLTFSQLDVTLDGNTAKHSDWGAVDLNFSGANGILYFNLAVRNPKGSKDRWEVQNVPVLSREGAGVFQTLTFNFDIGVDSGTHAPVVYYGYALTPQVLTAMPDVVLAATATESPYEIDSGFQGERMKIAKAEPLVGGAVAGPAFSHDFPNQDCGKNECTPAAVSNSLMFLNDKNSLGIAASELTIAKMKTATNWQPGGTDQNGWFKSKAQYMMNKGFPITTKTINPTSPADVAAAVRDGCDVELSTNTHTAAVVGIVEQANGHYAIEVAHDTVQGKPGGTKVESVDFNPKSTKLAGGAWLDNTKVKHFVVECAKSGT
jgi:hypothetical protein